MNRAAGELPEEPAIHRAEAQLAALCTLLSALNVVQYPSNLGGGKIGVGDQAGGPADVPGQATALQFLAEGCRAAALPDDGVIDGPACCPFPDEGSLALVRDADGGDHGGVYPLHRLLHHGKLTVPNLHGIVLDPAGIQIDLGKFPLGRTDDVLLLVE